MSFMPTGFVWNRRNVGWFIHQFTVGASGAISSQDAQNVSGLVASKDAAAGRYLLTGPAGTGFRSFKGGFACLTGPATAQYGAISVGLDSIMRANHMDDRTNPPTFYLQFVGSSTNFADADVPSGTVVNVFVAVEF